MVHVVSQCKWYIPLLRIIFLNHFFFQNDTHVTYKTTLNTDQSRRTSTAIWQQNSFAHFEIPFTCVFPLSEYARTSFIPTYVDPIISITGTGEYAAQMLIYQSKGINF